MTKDTGGPAFSSQEWFDGNGNTLVEASPGMTLRDWFAGQALAGTVNFPNAPDFENAARLAYAMADYMIAERNKP